MYYLVTKALKTLIDSRISSFRMPALSVLDCGSLHCLEFSAFLLHSARLFLGSSVWLDVDFIDLNLIQIWTMERFFA